MAVTVTTDLVVRHSMDATSNTFADGSTVAWEYYYGSTWAALTDEFKKALIIFYEQGTIYHIKKLFIRACNFCGFDLT